jgi:hypothetical protein
MLLAMAVGTAQAIKPARLVQGELTLLFRAVQLLEFQAARGPVKLEAVALYDPSNT